MMILKSFYDPQGMLFRMSVSADLIYGTAICILVNHLTSKCEYDDHLTGKYEF